MELEITWGRTIRVWWSLLWRNLIAIVLAIILGAITGAIIGIVLGMMGVPLNTIRIICAPVGFVIGLAVSIVPLKMILGKDYGEFKLVLLKYK